MKTHIRDIRLFNNAGISMPVCYAGATPLDTDKCRLPCAPVKQATCKRCQRAYPKKYPWTQKGSIE